ncbi:MAG: hypothetical protein IJ447_00010 [Clostridia bacterium]|nr:hypothetical protein [Clostridia bacterium]
MKYVLVPEFHSDGKSIHFHGLMNFDALKVIRAVNNKQGSRYFGQPLFDDKGREIYNISDYTLGHTTVIPIDGDNGREACAKYCYKYIIKSGGQKVGGRYYLSGGNLGRPRYELINLDYDSINEKEISVGTYMGMKRINIQEDFMKLTQCEKELFDKAYNFEDVEIYADLQDEQTCYLTADGVHIIVCRIISYNEKTQRATIRRCV